jgi:hypothetical protein
MLLMMAELPIQRRIALSYGKSEFIRMCSFNGQQCDIITDFKLHVDATFGNCYTFNPSGRKLISNRAGPSYGKGGFTTTFRLPDIFERSSTDGVCQRLRLSADDRGDRSTNCHSRSNGMPISGHIRLQCTDGIRLLVRTGNGERMLRLNGRSEFSLA